MKRHKTTHTQRTHNAHNKHTHTHGDVQCRMLKRIFRLFVGGSGWDVCNTLLSCASISASSSSSFSTSSASVCVHVLLWSLGSHQNHRKLCQTFARTYRAADAHFCECSTGRWHHFLTNSQTTADGTVIGDIKHMWKVATLVSHHRLTVRRLVQPPGSQLHKSS